jgi:hypothetical protein
VKDDTPHSHKRRYAGGAERLRAPQRMALLETVRVVQLCGEGISAATVLDVGTGSGVFAEAFVAAAKRVAVFERPCREEEQGPPLAFRLQPDKILSLARQAGDFSIERLELARMDLYRRAP